MRALHVLMFFYDLMLRETIPGKGAAYEDVALHIFAMRWMLKCHRSKIWTNCREAPIFALFFKDTFTYVFFIIKL